MKKVKYLFMFFIMLCFMPNIVNATQNVYFKSYKIGDKITVTLDKDKKIKGNFIVIDSSEEKNINLPDNYDFSAATEEFQYVTAIYDGTIGESIFGKNKEQLLYENSILRSNLVIKTKDLGWVNYKEIRYLKKSDLENIGGNNYKFSELVKKYPWLSLEEAYWLGDDGISNTTGGACVPEKVCDSSGICTTVPKCESITTFLATNISKGEVSQLNINSSIGMRPVIKIHKGFVDGGMVCNCTDCEEGKPAVENKVCPNDSKISIQKCIDEGTKEELCIKKICPGTEKTENPKTGSYIPFIVLGLGMISLFICTSTKNKTYFRKIK